MSEAHGGPQEGWQQGKLLSQELVDASDSLASVISALGDRWGALIMRDLLLKWLATTIFARPAGSGHDACKQ